MWIIVPAMVALTSTNNSIRQIAQPHPSATFSALSLLITIIAPSSILHLNLAGMLYLEIASRLDYYGVWGVGA